MKISISTDTNQKNDDILLTPEFEQVLQVLKNDMYKCIFVTGKAGTGKSTLLKYYVENVAPKGKTVVLAPTGIAAVNVGGQTIHSFFRFPTRIMVEDDEDIERLTQTNKNDILPELKGQLIRALEVIIIDEISMVRADIIDAIDTYLRINTQNYQPFGGKKMIFLGDLFQLPPILGDNKSEQQDLIEDFKKRYKSPFFFEAKVFQKQPIHLVELQTVHRQKDTEFIQILNHIRVANIKPFNDPNINTLNKKYIPKAEINFHDCSINLLTKNADVDNFNHNGLAQLSGKLYTYQGVIQNQFNLNNLPAPMELHLKVGAQVMFLKNKSLALNLKLKKHDEHEEDDPKQNDEYHILSDLGWQNGTLGKIEYLDEKNIVVSIKEDDNDEGRLVLVEKEVWENIRYEYDVQKKKVIQTVLGTYTQYPLKLAYAITIHKSQGMTFQKVNIDVSNAFAEGQVYVALSRARSLSGITLLNPVDPYKIKVSPRVIEFYKKYQKT